MRVAGVRKFRDKKGEENGRPSGAWRIVAPIIQETDFIPLPGQHRSTSSRRIYYLVLNLAALLSMLVVWPTYAQTHIVYEDDFEAAPPLLWDVDNGLWEVGTPSAGPGECFSGTQCVGTVLDGNYPEETNTHAVSRLISASIQLPEISGNEELSLRFRNWFSWGTSDSGQVQISVQDAQTGEFSAFENVGSAYSYKSAVWVSAQVDLSVYAGQRVRVAFRHSNNCTVSISCNRIFVGSGWYIDDVEVVVKVPTFTGDFESGLDDWSVDNGLWEVGTPAAGPGSCFSGTQCVGTVLGGDYPEETDTHTASRLISASIQLPEISGNEELLLRFRNWFSWGTSDSGQVQISVQDAQTGEFSAFENVGSAYSYKSTVWVSAQVDLSVYAGQRVRVAFRHSNNCTVSISCNRIFVGSGWYIDDVELVARVPTFTGDFESGLDDWSVDNGLWEVGTPAAGPGSCFSGTQCVGTVLDGDYPEETDTHTASRLISASIQLREISGNEELSLRFRNWFSWGTSDSGQVQISVQDAQTGEFSAFENVGSAYSYKSAVWVSAQVDLSVYAGQRVRIAFRHSNSCTVSISCNRIFVSSGWYIDEVELVAKVPTFTGDFESGLDDWSVDNGLWEVGVPAAGPESCLSGTQCVGTVLDGDYPEDDDTHHASRLISPVIMLPVVETAQTVVLSFSHWFSWGTSDSGRIQISVQDDTTGLFSAFQTLAENVGSSGGWSSRLVDLTNYAGRKVRLGFHHSNNCTVIFSCNGIFVGSGWYLDDVRILALPQLEEIFDQKISFTEQLSIPITVTDSVWEPLIVTVTGLPSFGSFSIKEQLAGRISGSIDFNPKSGDQGSYGPITVTMEDGSLTAEETFMLIVTVPPSIATAPVSDAGDDQLLLHGSELILDGSGSFDANGDPITYNWTLVTKPIASIRTTASIVQDSASPLATFSADVDGSYVIQLMVNDGGLDSAPDFVTITVDSPSIKVTSPSDGAFLKQLFRVTGTTNEVEVPIDAVELVITDGEFFLRQLNSGSLIFTSSPSVLIATDTSQTGDFSRWALDTPANFTNDTTYTITARAFDVEGGSSETSISFNFADSDPDFTTLDLDLSTSSILFDGMVDATIKLTEPGDVDLNLAGSEVAITFTDPDGNDSVVTAKTNEFGQATVLDLGAEDSGVRFNKKGTWLVSANFAGSAFVKSSQSQTAILLVGTAAGYAVIVQGRISNQEGLASHNKTTNRIYRAFLDRGFADQNIFYFNHDPAQDANEDGVPDDQQPEVGVDARPDKSAIQSAIEGMSIRVNENPAPMYVVLVDHGGDNRFFLDGDLTILPAELDSWLDTMEAGLDPSNNADDEPRVIINGSCYSGGFIDELSGPNRILISSAEANEESYKGALEPDGIRSGEFFLEELFQSLVKGATFAAAFELATDKTEVFTRRGGSSANTINRFFDQATQHPLLDDNGDGLGSNVLNNVGGDGALARELILGFGPNFDTNRAGNPADVVAVTPTIVVDVTGTEVFLYLRANDNADVAQAYVEIREPAQELLPANGTEQLEADFIRRQLLEPGNAANPFLDRFSILFDGLTTPGKYEVFYYVEDVETGNISPSQRSVVYKNKGVNSPPSSFNLLSPADGSQTKTVTFFDWQDATVDASGEDPSDLTGVTYTLRIADDATFTIFNGKEGVFQQEDLVASHAAVDDAAGLKDGASYFWVVEAFDGFGARTVSSNGPFQFNTDNQNNVPGIIKGLVHSDVSFARLAGAQLVATVGLISSEQFVTGPDGTFILITNSGDVVLTSTLTGFQTAEITGLNLLPGKTLAGIKVGMLPKEEGTKADLSISISAVSKITLGQDLTYTLTLSNNGQDTATNISVTQDLPGTAQFVSAPDCSAPLTNTLHCAVASLASATSVSFTVTVKPLSAGTATTSVGVLSDTFDPDNSNNKEVVQVQVEASPSPTFDVNVSIEGSGSVSGPDINCGFDCSAVYDEGTRVSFSATAADGFEFVRWEGSACESSGSICAISIGKDLTLAAVFKELSAGPNPIPVKLKPPKIIELQIVGIQVTSPMGESVTIPSAATAVSLNVTVVNPVADGFVTVWPCGIKRPLSSNLNFVAGSVVPNGVIAPLGQNGSVCLYSSRETDIIVDVAGWFEEDAFSGATPERLVDTRDDTGGPPGQLFPSSPLSINVTNLVLSDSLGESTVVPSDLNAVALNVTVVNPNAAGFITVYPCDVDRPLSSNVNYLAGQIIANGVVVPVSVGGSVCFFSSAPTDLVVDLAGWFAMTATETFVGATPRRFVDTRESVGGKLTPESPLIVPIHGEILEVDGANQQIPMTAKAAALNVTIVNPEKSGFATVWPCSAARPKASNLNFTTGQVVANNVFAPIGENGFICFYTNVASHIVVDVAGYFSGDAGNTFIGVTPKRLLDTREGLGPAPG